ncbi:protein-export chaperone SecB [Ferruginivarius sediminum]|uniref:Protein-export protein SecB n=1 Tax=Ferruginivarius sediminum TaxID=2661937 RepID=A0A369TD72_9PROT|nr:protein-export chaperone SecB [Ferruginivarius sediminum]RDD63273.1 protein-export chaperone SecB [Ferruginivarius sediminum]
MADESTSNPAAGDQGADAQGTDTGFTIHTQYIKDLSVENPNAPHVFMEMKEAPAVTVNLDVTASRLQENTYEVSLHANVKATVQDKSAFVIELTYGGVVTVEGEVPGEKRETLLLIEAPRYLFPTARNIIGGATRDAGYPPLLINPVDFAKLYREQKAAWQKQQAEQAQQSSDGGADA